MTWNKAEPLLDSLEVGQKITQKFTADGEQRTIEVVALTPNEVTVMVTGENVNNPDKPRVLGRRRLLEWLSRR